MSSTAVEIDTLKKQYMCNLATFKEYYTLTHMYPNDQTYLKEFNNAKTNLTQLSKNLFLLNNELQKKIENMKRDTESLNYQLDNHEDNKDTMKTELEYAQTQVGGAAQLSEDYKVLYTDQYILNWSFVIGIIVAGYVTYKTFSKKEE